MSESKSAPISDCNDIEELSLTEGNRRRGMRETSSLWFIRCGLRYTGI